MIKGALRWPTFIIFGDEEVTHFGEATQRFFRLRLINQPEYSLHISVIEHRSK